MSACGIRAAHTDCLGVGVPPRGLRALQGAGECRFLRLRTGSSTGALGLRLEADVFVRVRDSEGNRLFLCLASPCNPFVSSVIFKSKL